MRDESQDATLDGTAAALSSLCLLHCLLLPVGLGVAAVFSGLPGGDGHANEWVHWALLALAAPVSGYALWRGMALHGDAWPWKFAALGFALMAAGALAHGAGPAEQLLTVLGGFVVAFAHWRNWRARREA
ncbi:MAG: MerC domain-containing protein [Sandarakinorhabdus sp.]|nr:MerC domain-containing protein [Sandarakinorhabdus sp.]